MKQDEIMEMAVNAGANTHFIKHHVAFIEKLSKLVAAKEQERCCLIIYGLCDSDNVAERTVKAIRGEA